MSFISNIKELSKDVNFKIKYLNTLSKDEIVKMVDMYFKHNHININETINIKSDEIVHKEPVSTNYTSYDRGKIGEELFQNNVVELFDSIEYEITNTTSIPNKGDFLVSYTKNNTKYKCMVEIKNYTNKVQANIVKEFNKNFKNSKYDCAIIISYNTNFSFTNDNLKIMDNIIYLSNINPEKDYNKYLIKACIELLLNNSATNNNNFNNNIIHIANLIETLNTLSKSATSIATNANKMNETIKELYNDLKIAIKNCKN